MRITFPPDSDAAPCRDCTRSVYYCVVCDDWKHAGPDEE